MNFKSSGFWKILTFTHVFTEEGGVTAISFHRGYAIFCSFVIVISGTEVGILVKFFLYCFSLITLIFSLFYSENI